MSIGQTPDKDISQVGGAPAEVGKTTQKRRAASTSGPTLEKEAAPRTRSASTPPQQKAATASVFAENPEIAKSGVLEKEQGAAKSRSTAKVHETPLSQSQGVKDLQNFSTKWSKEASTYSIPLTAEQCNKLAENLTEFRSHIQSLDQEHQGNPEWPQLKEKLEESYTVADKGWRQAYTFHSYKGMMPLVNPTTLNSTSQKAITAIKELPTTIQTIVTKLKEQGK